MSLVTQYAARKSKFHVSFFSPFDGFFFLTVYSHTLFLTDGGKSVVATIVDRCADCDIPTNVDLSPVAFSGLADQSVGRLFDATWDYTEDAPGLSITVGLGISVRSEKNQTMPDLTARGEGTTTPPSVVVGKRSSAETKRENGSESEKLTKRTEPEVPPSVVSGDAPGGVPASHGKRRFSESFKRADMQKRGRMVRRHRRSVAHQSMDEPVA